MDKGQYLSLFQANERSMEAALQAVETSLNVHICLHDPHGLFHGANLGWPRFRHWHDACRHQRKGEADRRCLQTCLQEVGERARRSATPEIKRCWKDLVEVVVPVYHEDVFQFVMFAGVFRAAPKSEFFKGEMAHRYAALPECDVERAEAISRVLSHVGHSLLLQLEDYYASAGQGDDRREIIKRFIFHHATKKVSLEDLASHLFLSPSRTSHLVSDLFGRSFSDLIKEERIKRACSILRHSRKPIGDIPPLVGIENEYYFFRLFKKETGFTPKKYRDEHA